MNCIWIEKHLDRKAFGFGLNFIFLKTQAKVIDLIAAYRHRLHFDSLLTHPDCPLPSHRDSKVSNMKGRGWRME